jgi:ADP-ribose pyrophosphatase YjhB (NUDIX family)
VLAAVIEYDGQILLARNAAWPGRMFALITGFMEAGETPQEGIAREMAGRNQSEVSALNLIGVYDFQRMNQVIIAYHAQWPRRGPAVAGAGRVQAVTHRQRCVLAGRHRLCAGRLAASRGHEPQLH